MTSLPFSTDGFTHQAFAHALCQHKRLTGRREKQAREICRLCDEWSRRDPHGLRVAHVWSDVVAVAKAKQDCERYVKDAIGVSIFSFLLIRLIVTIVRLFVDWFLSNYGEVKAAQNAT